MVDIANAPALAILTRAPSSGGKTRLFASLGISTDPALLQALLLDTLDGTVAPGVRRIVAVTPADACEEVRLLIDDADVEVMPQPEGGLGERMHAIMEALFARHASVVALIGSDLPHMALATIEEAFQICANDPDALVLGPAADGGYYLIAARRLPEVFRDVDWTGNRVCNQTEQAAVKQGLHVRHLAVMADVDNATDLRRAVESGAGVRTRAWLAGVDGLK